MDRKSFLRSSGLIAAGLGLLPKAMYSEKPELGNPYAFINLQQSPLKYELNGLEPYISGEIMDLHYNKHAAGYLRKLLYYLEDHGMPKDDLFALIKSDMQDDVLINNLGGHFNHEIFWRTLSKNKSISVSKLFADKLKADLGGVENAAKIFGDAAGKVFGSGWAWLCVDANSGKLFVTTTPNQDNPLMQRAEKPGYPLIGIDVWEHAYYLQYQNRRPEYIAAFGELLDWGFADTMYQKVTKWIR